MLSHDENEKDIVEIPKTSLRKLDVRPVSTIDEVLELALTKMPKTLPAAIEAKKDTSSNARDGVTTH